MNLCLLEEKGHSIKMDETNVDIKRRIKRPREYFVVSET